MDQDPTALTKSVSLCRLIQCKEKSYYYNYARMSTYSFSQYRLFPIAGVGKQFLFYNGTNYFLKSYALRILLGDFTNSEFQIPICYCCFNQEHPLANQKKLLVDGIQKFYCNSKNSFAPLFFYGLSKDLKAIIEFISGQELQRFECDRHIVFLPFMAIFIFQKFLGKQKSFYPNILKYFKLLFFFDMKSLGCQSQPI